MKKILSLLVFASAILHAQYTIKGTMTPPDKNDWVALYKIEGRKQRFIKHIKVKVSTGNINGTKQKSARFEFTLPKNAESGAYRAAYRETGTGFVDFFFNKENIEMIFNPQYPEQSVVYTESLENKVYSEYLDAQTLSQKKIDGLQEKFLKTKDKSIKKEYKKELSKLSDSQKIYENKSKGMFINAFVKSSKIENPSSPIENENEYRNFVVANYFKNINFNNKSLKNSAFLINKISDYIFYLKTADSQKLQQKLYRESISKVMAKASSEALRKDFSEFLISTFANKRNSEIVDWVISSYYNKISTKDEKFKKEKLDLLKVSVGRKAPDFSWKENGKTLKLSTLKDGENYLLIFWSTQCSHCIKEIPDVYNFMKKHKKTSVIAFAIEDTDMDFNSWKKNKLYNWHNVIGKNPGGNRFENKIVRKYLIDATPTYFVLDKNKKIIAVPNEGKDVKDYFNKK